MGVVNSAPKNTLYWNIRTKYHITKQDRERNISYATDMESGRQVIIKEIVTNDYDEKAWVNNLVFEKTHAKFRYLLKLIESSVEKQEGSCQSVYRISLVFERPYKTLRNEIQLRKKQGKIFHQEEILRMLKVGVSALKFLNQIGESHQRISTHNILINSSGYFFISDPWLSFQPEVIPTTKNTYLSPEKCRMMRNEIQQIDEYKSDLFSLGMVGLEVIGMEQLHQLYNRKYQIDFEGINRRVSEIENQKLKTCIKSLLSKSREKRERIAYQIERNEYKSHEYSPNFIKAHQELYDISLKNIDSVETVQLNEFNKIPSNKSTIPFTNQNVSYILIDQK